MLIIGWLYKLEIGSPLMLTDILCLSPNYFSPSKTLTSFRYRWVFQFFGHTEYHIGFKKLSSAQFDLYIFWQTVEKQVLFKILPTFSIYKNRGI